MYSPLYVVGHASRWLNRNFVFDGGGVCAHHLLAEVCRVQIVFDQLGLELSHLELFRLILLIRI
jgi:hypothetical protein